jgi:hypothetical protein
MPDQMNLLLRKGRSARGNISRELSLQIPKLENGRIDLLIDGKLLRIQNTLNLHSTLLQLHEAISQAYDVVYESGVFGQAVKSGYSRVEELVAVAAGGVIRWKLSQKFAQLPVHLSTQFQDFLLCFEVGLGLVFGSVFGDLFLILDAAIRDCPRDAGSKDCSSRAYEGSDVGWWLFGLLRPDPSPRHIKHRENEKDQECQYGQLYEDVFPHSGNLPEMRNVVEFWA